MAKSFDYSGWSVATNNDGSRIAIGAPSNNGASGHVRVYDYSNGSWSQVGSDIDGEANSDDSGRSVAMSSDGTRIAIGAPYNDGNNGKNSGHVRVYDYSNGSWSQVGSDIDGEATGDLSGYSVAISSDGSRIAIGATYSDGVNGNSSGHVRVYDYSNGSWSQVGSDIDGEVSYGYSGDSVAMSSDGNRIAIGATYSDGVNGNYSGHVRVYDYSNGSWSQVGSDIDGEGRR